MTDPRVEAARRLAWRPTDDEGSFAGDYAPEGYMVCNLCGKDPCCCGVPTHFVATFRKTQDALRDVLALLDALDGGPPENLREIVKAAITKGYDMGTRAGYDAPHPDDDFASAVEAFGWEELPKFFGPAPRQPEPDDLTNQCPHHGPAFSCTVCEPAPLDDVPTPGGES